MENKQSSSSVIRQLQVVFIISLGILLISSFASYYSIRELIDTSRLVNHTNDVIIEGNNLLSIVRDAEAGQRGYIITDNNSFLSRYESGYDLAMTSHSRLRSLTADNAVQQKNLDNIKVLIDRRFEQMKRTMDLVQSPSFSKEGNTKELVTREMLNGKQIMEEMRLIILRMKDEENRLLKIRIDEQDKYANYTPILVIIAALISIVITLISYLRIKRDVDERIKKQLQDEALYNETNRRIAIMENTTNRIAAGEFATRNYDEGKDELNRISVALNNMAATLEENFNDQQRRNWLQTGTLQVADAVRGERFVKIVAGKVLNTISSYINAQIGTLYLADNERHLRLIASFATTQVPETYDYTSGLLGQAISTNKLIVVDDVPAGYLRVASSIGEAEPAYLMLIPFSIGQEVIAVAELGMLKKPEEIELELLKKNAEAIAISLNAAVNYERMQNLLEETQAQSEELQSQHNELENINAELEAQSEKLQASEEELKVQQEELQQANSELEERARLLEESNQKIAEQNHEVKQKAEELAMTTKYKSEFLANMSHELRTPLNSILLLSRLLSENTDSNLSNDQIEYANVIQSSGYGLLALIDEILDLSKIESGKMELEYESTEIKDIVNDIRALFEPVANEKNLDFIIAVDKNTPLSIETDKLRLEQIIKNLISNALKFTSKGNVTLSVNRHETDNSLLNFTVTDTGIGIAEEKQKLIFEAFQQADGSTRRKYGGTGLGLSISKELSRLLGGTLTLSSKEGAGSSFTISVPYTQGQAVENEININTTLHLSQEAATEPKEPNPYISNITPEDIPDDRAEITAGEKSILIIEDDTSFAKSLLEYTRKKGYKGIVSVRGDTGFELAKQYLPTGILLDIQLPVVSGWDVMKQLKEHTATRHIPVHMMSSYQMKKQSMIQGAIDFISKPVAFEQMQQVFKKLEEVLSRDPKKVLIVEDNSKHAKALAYFLETYNITSEVKHNVADSIDALTQKADCVILDMGIPSQRGYDILEEVKQNPGLEHLPIIIFTGKSLSLPEEQRIKKYADSIIVKTAHSYQRILDEISIFLHLVEESKKPKKDDNNRKLAMLNDVLKDKTVLIVDDDVRNIFSISKALEKLNMNVITAVDGKEGIQKLQENSKIDVVLLDMMMPEMDGYETASKIRSNPQWKNLPVIAVTAKAMTGDRDKCINAGASDYISKPVDIDQLLSLLRVWLYEKN